jgi:hypothetical protein
MWMFCEYGGTGSSLPHAPAGGLVGTVNRSGIAEVIAPAMASAGVAVVPAAR